MADMKEYATQQMLKKENSGTSIEKEWKKDSTFLSGQIDDVKNSQSSMNNTSSK